MHVLTQLPTDLLSTRVGSITKRTRTTAWSSLPSAADSSTRYSRCPLNATMPASKVSEFKFYADGAGRNVAARSGRISLAFSCLGICLKHLKEGTFQCFPVSRLTLCESWCAHKLFRLQFLGKTCSSGPGTLITDIFCWNWSRWLYEIRPLRMCTRDNRK